MPMLMPNSDNSVQGKPPSTGIEEEVWCRQRCKSCSNGTHTGITQIQIQLPSILIWTFDYDFVFHIIVKMLSFFSALIPATTEACIWWGLGIPTNKFCKR